MDRLFELISEEEKGSLKSVRIGIRLKISDRDEIYPVSAPCRSLESLKGEIEYLQAGLERIGEEASPLFEGAGVAPAPGTDMDAEQIWGILSAAVDETAFVDGFNGLDEGKRREVAEYVLTKCNVFSGRASLFSLQYNSETGRLE